MDAIDGNGGAALFGNHFVTQEVPTRRFPDSGMPATDAMRLCRSTSPSRATPSGIWRRS